MGRTFRGQDRERQKKKYLEIRKIKQTKRVENVDEYGKPKRNHRQAEEDNDYDFDEFGV